MKDILVIGGGLAGLVSAVHLAKAGLPVTVIEKKPYPFHRVCGEYISNEVLPYLASLGLAIESLRPAHLTHLLLSSPTGKTLEMPLDLGGFGLSRYKLDYALYELARSTGVNFLLGKSVERVSFQNDRFEVTLSGGESVTSVLVIGAYGKRSRLDKQLNRPFMRAHSPYVGVKYHIRYPAAVEAFPRHLIALHNFSDGYCGTSAIEEDKYCLCYLTTRENLRKHGSIAAMEQAILYKNPHLEYIFTGAEFLFDKPEVINEISFAPKLPVEAHVLMAGDSAGLITPLCGNGMAMAIHGAYLLSKLILRYTRGEITRAMLEMEYTRQWNAQFRSRLWIGRQVQRLFGDPWLTEATVGFFHVARPLARLLVKTTHGKVFGVPSDVTEKI